MIKKPEIISNGSTTASAQGMIRIGVNGRIQTGVSGGEDLGSPQRPAVGSSTEKISPVIK